MHRKSAWSTEEDQLIAQLMAQVDSSVAEEIVDWTFISKELYRLTKIIKTSRQCKDRWKNHLREGRTRQMTETERYLNQLFDLQHQHGNQWKFFESQFPGLKHIEIKNLFYSTLKKSIRLLNSYITSHRQSSLCKNLRVFPQNCIFKIIKKEQGNNRKLLSDKGDIEETARKIKDQLFKLNQNRSDQALIKELIEQISYFNRHCHKLRRKKCRRDNSVDKSEIIVKEEQQYSNQESRTYEIKTRRNEKFLNRKEIFLKSEAEDNFQSQLPQSHPAKTCKKVKISEMKVSSTNLISIQSVGPRDLSFTLFQKLKTRQNLEQRQTISEDQKLITTHSLGNEMINSGGFVFSEPNRRRWITEQKWKMFELVEEKGINGHLGVPLFQNYDQDSSMKCCENEDYDSEHSFS